MNIDLTAAAKIYITKNIELKRKSCNCLGIKLGTKRTGCSGLTYIVEYIIDELPINSEIIRFDNFVICVSNEAVKYLNGLILDFKENKFESGLDFLNPNEKSTCGCGKSFNV